MARETIRDWVRVLERADPTEQWTMLCFLAGRAVEVEEDELNGAVRRAELLLAAGGDPRRELDPFGRAATALGATERYLGAFLAGRRLPACRDPSSFRSVPPPPARPGRSLRRAAVLTVGDSLRQAAMRRDHLRGLVAAARFGGLRGGSVSAGRRRLVCGTCSTCPVCV